MLIPGPLFAVMFLPHLYEFDDLFWNLWRA